MIAFSIALLLLFGASHAFQSTNLYTRPIIYNSLPTTAVTASFTASNLDSTGGFQLDSGCSGTITVAPPVINFVVTLIGKVPRDVVSVEEISCSVLSLDAYRTNLEASGESLDLVLVYDADNVTVVPGNDTTAMRRRLLQVNGDEPPGDRVRSFAAVSTAQSDEARESLNVLDAKLYTILSGYSPVANPQPTGRFLGASNPAEALKNAQSRQVDVTRKLIQRAQNTDLAVQYLTDFIVQSYEQQQTNISQLFAAQNETNLAVIYIYNTLIQSIQNSVDITTATATAIQGLIDFREADRSVWSSWIANNELRELGSLLYWNDVSQLPSGYEPLVRHPGVAPNASQVEAAVLLDVLTQNTVGRVFTLLTQDFPNYAAILQNTFSTYMSSSVALLFPTDQADSRFLVSLLGPSGCTPPSLNSSKTYVDVTQWSDSIVGRSPVVNQTFSPAAPVCDVYVEAEICACGWGTGPTTYDPTFRWSNNADFVSGKNPSLASVCSNPSNTDQIAPIYQCSSMIITSPAQLTSVLNINFCGNQCNQGGSDLPCYPLIESHSTGVDQVDLMYFFSQTLQLQGNSSAHNCPYNGLVAASMPTTLPSGGSGTTVDNYYSVLVAGFFDSAERIARLRMAKYGRLAGVETQTVSSNQYMQTLFNPDGSANYYDASSTPLRCEKSTWNAYSSDLLPVYSFRVNGAQVVTNNIQVVVTCPVCNNSDACYNPTATLSQRVLTYDTGSFLLDGSFVTVGNLTALGNGGYVYDLPPDKASVSSIIESRSFTPLYIFLNSNATTMPDWNTFVSLNPRNQRYSAQFGGVSIQAYKQATVFAPGGQQIVCASNETAAIPGSHFCSILSNYALNYSATTGLATFSPIHWQVSFDVTINSGLYFDTVNTGNGCPIITLQPTSSGSLTLAMQNDQTVPSQVRVFYQPVNNSVGITCPGVCCNAYGSTTLISPRYTSYYEIPQCGWINLTISVDALQGDGVFLPCFNASGESLFSQLVSASTALDVQFLNPVNYTRQYDNMLADFYVQQAYQAILDYQTAQADYSERSQALIRQLKSRRDYYQQQISSIQLLIGFTPTFPLNATKLGDTVSGLLAQNTAIDEEVLTVDLPYIQKELDSIRTTGGLGSDLLNWVGGLKDGAEVLGGWFSGLGDKGKDVLDRIRNSFGSDGECPEGLFDAIVNSVLPGKPGILNYLSCVADDLLTGVITVVCVLLFGCCLWYCFPPIASWACHKIIEKGEQHRKRMDRAINRQANKGKDKGKKSKEYSEVETEEEDDEGVNTDEYDSDAPQRQRRKKKTSFNCWKRR
ncbi:MAG: hypothetical protein JWP40_4777 [Blastococcus sp.]|nr:hypothetical protein [Blastococcus sp.]